MTQPRLNKDDAYTAKREDGSTIYYRTGKGSHRHASFYCANGKRSIFTGDCFPIDAAEVDQWAPCLDCCSDAEKSAHAATETTKLDAQCPNGGLIHNVQRIYNVCKDCGKEGKTNRTTGRLRAHKPTSEPHKSWVALQK